MNLKKNKLKVVRPQNLINNIAIVDGFSGTGKSLIMPLLSHLKGGEVWQISEETEGVCLLEYLNKIDYDAAKALVRRNFDKRIYDLSLARNVNFRASDDSSIQGTLLTSKYKKRMKDKTERKPIVKRIQKEKPLFIMDAHYIFGNSDLYFKSFDDSLSIYIFMLRNPSHLVNAYFNQDLLARIGKDPMEIELCIEIDNKVLPYYVTEYYQEYNKANNDLEKAIIVIYKYLSKVYDMYDALTEKEKEKFYFISFENFTTNPTKFMDKICGTLNTKPSKSYKKMFKHLNMPREKEKVDYNQTYKLSKQQDLPIRKKYKKMLDKLISQHKLFLKSEINSTNN